MPYQRKQSLRHIDIRLTPWTGASAPQPQDDYAFSYQFDGAFLLSALNIPVVARFLTPSPSPPLSWKFRPNLPSWQLVADLSAEVDRAHENLQKSGKAYAMGGRRK